MREVFRKFARGAADAVASPAAFLLGVFTTLIWAATGSFFHYSDTWVQMESLTDQEPNDLQKEFQLHRDENHSTSDVHSSRRLPSVV